jgi:hypothetical protein
LDHWHTFFELSFPSGDDRCVVLGQIFFEQPLRKAVWAVANETTILKDLLVASLSAGFLFVLGGNQGQVIHRQRGSCVGANLLGAWLGGAWACAESQGGISVKRI